MPACDGPIDYRDTAAVRADIAALRAAIDGADVEEAFLSAASPGVVAFFVADRHYGDQEAYLYAIADAMKVEYDEIHRAGLLLLLDCPDIAFTRAARRGLVRGRQPRHAHEWTVFEDVELPDGKVLIPGVLDSTTNYVEHPELVAQRIVRYARLVGRESVIAGTDCGFASFAGSSAVDPQIVWAKLGAMAEGAELASRALW